MNYPNNPQTTGIQCYLVEPIYGERVFPGDGRPQWEPDKEIIGWIRKDTGETKKHNYEWGLGAMWFAVWQPPQWCWDNETEPHLIVRCPDGANGMHDWDIDSRASNCTLKNDRLHRCWVRHGTPPMIHVDKQGVTCQAGAGSIWSGKWHGFLTNGVLQVNR